MSSTTDNIKGVGNVKQGIVPQILVRFTNAYKRVGEEVNAAIKATEKVDPTTSNLLQEVEHGIAKYQWQMQSQVQRTKTDPNTGWDLNDNKPVDLSPQPVQRPGDPKQ